MPEEETRLSRDEEWARRELTDERLEKARAIAAIADDLGVSMAQLAIGWLLRLPQVSSVITGATKLSHLKDNLESPTVLDKLSESDLARIDEILGPVDLLVED